ncbi:MAG: histidinol-phosphatase HisJ family protein [Planctomycetota bacterium]
MGFFDQHLHSRHSFDCRTDPRANVESAIARGLSGLTFTEHFDTHPDDWAGCVYDDAAYSQTIESLRREFDARIFIGKGIEVCYQPSRMDFILDFLASHEFDLVILSVHYFAGVPVHRRDPWNGVDADRGTRLYLENVLEAVRFCEQLHRGGTRVFDVLGHLDVVKRYTHRFLGSYDVTCCADLIDEILHACVRADLTPEINTSSLRQGLLETMPGPSTVIRYAELGGQAMSLGSDAHRADDLGANFEKAVEMLREAGIGHAAVFQQRARRLEPI